MSARLIVLSWMAQEFLDRPRRRHLTTDPRCEHYRAPRSGSWLDRASRGLECEPCMIRRAFTCECDGRGRPCFAYSTVGPDRENGNRDAGAH